MSLTESPTDYHGGSYTLPPLTAQDKAEWAAVTIAPAMLPQGGFAAKDPFEAATGTVTVNGVAVDVTFPAAASGSTIAYDRMTWAPRCPYGTQKRPGCRQGA